MFVLVLTEYENPWFTSKEKTFLSREDVSDPHNFKGLFEGYNLVLRWRSELGQGQG